PRPAGALPPAAFAFGVSGGYPCSATNVALSPLKVKRRIRSNSFLSPVARFTSMNLLRRLALSDAAAPCPPLPRPPPPRPAPPPPRPPSPLWADRGGAPISPSHFESPDMAIEPPFSPTGILVSVAPCAVPRTTTVALPSLGATTYANHLPSAESAVCRMVFHA